MIRKTLPEVRATFAVLIPSPHPQHYRMPVPSGTGFFIDTSGYFLTARHVIDGVDPSDLWLQQELNPNNWKKGGDSSSGPSWSKSGLTLISPY